MRARGQEPFELISLSLSLACARALWADLSRPLLGLQRRCHAAALYPALDQAHQHHHVDWAHQLDSDHIELTDNDENIAARCSLKQRSLPGYLTPFFKIWFLWLSWYWFFLWSSWWLLFFMIMIMMIILKSQKAVLDTSKGFFPISREYEILVNVLSNLSISKINIMYL